MQSLSTPSLLDTLRSLYTITTDWTGSNYLVFTIDWYYAYQHVTISMPEHVKKALHRLVHERPKI